MTEADTRKAIQGGPRETLWERAMPAKKVVTVVFAGMARSYKDTVLNQSFRAWFFI